MKKVVVASANPVKVEAVRMGFERMFAGARFEFVIAEVPSGVGVQPVTDAETLLGARNRADQAAVQLPGADFYVGVEGGIDEAGGEMSSFSWVFIRFGARFSKARSAAYFLPPEVANLVRQGVELGEAMDRVFGRVNSKQENGAVGILTGDVIDRSRLYEPAVILALIPFKNPGLYSL